MIYLKTNLKKIPKTCNKCKFSKSGMDLVGRFQRKCIILNKQCPSHKTSHGNYAFGKLGNCPLIENNKGEI